MNKILSLFIRGVNLFLSRRKKSKVSVGLADALDYARTRQPDGRQIHQVPTPKLPPHRRSFQEKTSKRLIEKLEKNSNRVSSKPVIPLIEPTPPAVEKCEVCGRSHKTEYKYRNCLENNSTKRFREKAKIEEKKKRSCQGKQAFRSESEVMAASRTLVLNYYRCSFCDNYHMTSSGIRYGSLGGENASYARKNMKREREALRNRTSSNEFLEKYKNAVVIKRGNFK